MRTVGVVENGRSSVMIGVDRDNQDTWILLGVYSAVVASSILCS